MGEAHLKADAINSHAWEIRRTDIKRAYSLATDALSIARACAYNKGIAEALRTLGYAFWRFGDYRASMEKSLHAVQIFRELNDKKGEADTINNIGAVYAFLKDHQSRLESNLACLQLREQAFDLEGVAASLNNTGETYMEMGRIAEAQSYFSMCLKHPACTPQIKAWAYYNIAHIEFKARNIDEARLALENCINNAEKVSYNVLICAAYTLYSELHIHECEFEYAFGFLNRALSVASEHELKEDAFKVYRLFSDAYRKYGQPEKAFDYYKQYHQLKEKLYKENNTQNIRNLQFRYESEALKKEAEVERLRNVELKQAYDKIESQKTMLLAKNQQLEMKVMAITNSIEYARTLQNAILPDSATVNDLLQDAFVFYQPKDIVSGDFYRVDRIQDKLFVGVFDCTGHGVPGALMSILGYNALTRAMNSANDLDPGTILRNVSATLANVLNHYSNTEVNDGMDAAVLCMCKGSHTIRFSGAFNGIWIINDIGLSEIRGTRQPIGGSSHSPDKAFETKEIKIKKGDMIYLGTDGYADQFGFETGKKLKNSGLRKILLSIYNKPIAAQKLELTKAFESWKGELEQVDDVCIIGIRF